MSGTPPASDFDPARPSVFDEALDPELGKNSSGERRFAWNVLTSWAGHMVFVAAGFLMPRLIDRTLGQTALGVWDFGWVAISYFANLQLGIGISVNRHVAQHQSAGDVEGLRTTVSSVTVVDLAIGATILAAAWSTAAILPVVFADRLGVHVVAAQWLVALLGTTLAVQAAADAFRGVITGLHRWDIHNAINSGFYALTVAGMIVALKSGYGLKGLAVTYSVGHIAAELIRVVVAHRLAPGLHIGWRYVRRDTAHRMFIFGGKAFLDGISRLLLLQGNSLVVATFLGPAALAVFSRPNSLVRQAEAFLTKFAHVFTPTASSLQGQGRTKELRDLLIVGGRFATALALPLMGFLAIMADPILETWMGSRYEHGVVLSIMALGALLPMTQSPTATILVGLNLHGRVAAMSAVFMSFGLGFSVISVGYWGLGLVGAALAMAVPTTVTAGALAFYACRRLDIPIVEYGWRVYLTPILCASPYIAALVVLRIVFKSDPLAEIGLAVLASLLLLPLYWRYLLTGPNRAVLRATMRQALKGIGLA